MAISDGSGAMRISGVWTRLMISCPPAATTSIRSMMICLAAVAIAIRPDEHWRSMVMPDTVDRAAGAKRDLPADVAELRALGEHRAPDDVVDLAGVDSGALDRRLEREAAQASAPASR